MKTPLVTALACASLSLLATSAQAQDLIGDAVVSGSDTYAGVRYRDLDAASTTQDAFLGARFDDGSNRVTGRVNWAQGANAFTLNYDPMADRLTSVVTNGNGTYTLTYTGVAQRVVDQSDFTAEDLNALNILVLERQADPSVLAINDLRVNGKLLGNIASAANFDDASAGIRNFCFSNGFTLSGDLFLDGAFSGSAELSKVEFALGVDGPRGVDCVEPNDLALSLVPQADTAIPGETRDIQISVTNNGSYGALDNTIGIELDEGLRHVDTGVCTETDVDGRSVRCDLVDLAPQESAQVTLRVEVDDDAALAPATIGATVNSRIYDEDLTDNTDSASILVQAPVAQADLSVELVANPSPVNAGSVVVYTATLNSDGPDLAANARALVSFDAGLDFIFPGSCVVDEKLAACPLGDVAPDGSAQLQFDAQVPSDAAGSAAVTVTVLSDAEDPNESDNQAQLVTNIGRQANLGVRLTSGDELVATGDAVEFTLTVTNAGPSNQPAATVSSTISSQIGDLSWTCEAVGGASCPAVSGTGDLAETVGLPVNASLVFTLSGEAINGTGSLPNSAAISTADDPVTSNNTAEVLRRGNVMFRDGLEPENRVGGTPPR